MSSTIRHRRPLRQRLLAAALLLAMALPSPAYALRPEIEGTVQSGLDATLRGQGASVGLEETISPALRERLRTPLTPEQVRQAVEFLTEQFRPPPTPYQAAAMTIWFEPAGAKRGAPPVRLGAVAKILSNGQPFDEEVAKAFLIATRLWAKYGLTDKARDALITHFYWPEKMTDEAVIFRIRETAEQGVFRPDAEARTILQEAYAMRDRPALGSIEAEQRAAQRRATGLEEREKGVDGLIDRIELEFVRQGAFAQMKKRIRERVEGMLHQQFGAPPWRPGQMPKETRQQLTEQFFGLLEDEEFFPERILAMLHTRALRDTTLDIFWLRSTEVTLSNYWLTHHDWTGRANTPEAITPEGLDRIAQVLAEALFFSHVTAALDALQADLLTDPRHLTETQARLRRLDQLIRASHAQGDNMMTVILPSLPEMTVIALASVLYNEPPFRRTNLYGEGIPTEFYPLHKMESVIRLGIQARLREAKSIAPLSTVPPEDQLTVPLEDLLEDLSTATRSWPEELYNRFLVLQFLSTVDHLDAQMFQGQLDVTDLQAEAAPKALLEAYVTRPYGLRTIASGNHLDMRLLHKQLPRLLRLAETDTGELGRLAQHALGYFMLWAPDALFVKDPLVLAQGALARGGTTVRFKRALARAHPEAIRRAVAVLAEQEPLEAFRPTMWFANQELLCLARLNRERTIPVTLVDVLFRNETWNAEVSGNPWYLVSKYVADELPKVRHIQHALLNHFLTENGFDPVAMPSTSPNPRVGLGGLEENEVRWSSQIPRALRTTLQLILQEAALGHRIVMSMAEAPSLERTEGGAVMIALSRAAVQEEARQRKQEVPLTSELGPASRQLQEMISQSRAQRDAIEAIAARAQAAIGDRVPSIGEAIRQLVAAEAGNRIDAIFGMTGLDPRAAPYAVEALSVFRAGHWTEDVRAAVIQGYEELFWFGGEFLTHEDRVRIFEIFVETMSSDEDVAGTAATALASLLCSPKTNLKVVETLTTAMERRLAQLPAGPQEIIAVEYHDPDRTPQELGALDAVLRDPHALTVFLGILSVARQAIQYGDHLLMGPVTPLDLPRHATFHYRGMKVHASTESFRRFIVEIPQASGPALFVQLKMPGEDEDRDLITESHWTIAQALWRPGVPLVEPLAMVTMRGHAHLYGQAKDFTHPELPLRVVVYRYEDGNRLRNLLLDPAHFSMIAEDLGVAPTELHRRVVDQLIYIATWVLRAGYLGHDEETTDWHLENFLLLPDGRVMLVPDFGAYHPTGRPLQDVEIAREVMELLGPLLDVTTVDQFIARYLQATPVPPEHIWEFVGVPLPTVPRADGRISEREFRAAMWNGRWLQVDADAAGQHLGAWLAAQGFDLGRDAVYWPLERRRATPEDSATVLREDQSVLVVPVTAGLEESGPAQMARAFATAQAGPWAVATQTADLRTRKTTKEQYVHGFGRGRPVVIDRRQATQLVPGEVVRVLAGSPNWAEVEILGQPQRQANGAWAGYRGWVQRKFLQPLPDEPARPAPFSVATLTAERKSALRREVVANAQTRLGRPYAWGRNVDCSALVHLAYRDAGIVIPRDSADQDAWAAPLERGAELQPGDIIYLHPVLGKSRFRHVVLYLGDNEVIEARGAPWDREADPEQDVPGVHQHKLAFDVTTMQSGDLIPSGKRRLYFGTLLKPGTPILTLGQQPAGLEEPRISEDEVRIIQEIVQQVAERFPPSQYGFGRDLRDPESRIQPREAHWVLRTTEGIEFRPQHPGLSLRSSAFKGHDCLASSVALVEELVAHGIEAVLVSGQNRLWSVDNVAEVLHSKALVSVTPGVPSLQGIPGIEQVGFPVHVAPADSRWTVAQARERLGSVQGEGYPLDGAVFPMAWYPIGLGKALLVKAGIDLGLSPPYGKFIPRLRFDLMMNVVLGNQLGPELHASIEVPAARFTDLQDGLKTAGLQHGVFKIAAAIPGVTVNIQDAGWPEELKDRLTTEQDLLYYLIVKLDPEWVAANMPPPRTGGLEEEVTAGRVGFVLTGQTTQGWPAFAEQRLEFLVLADPGQAAKLRASGLEEAPLLVVERGMAWPEALAHARARLHTAGVETIRVLTDGNLIPRITEALRGARWPAEAIDRFLEQVRTATYT